MMECNSLNEMLTGEYKFTDRHDAARGFEQVVEGKANNL